MVNTVCTHCGFDLVTEPKRKRKCPSCKEDLYVIKDYYKVVVELLFKVKDESILQLDRYSNFEEYSLYALRKWLLSRLWYGGVLINDKADNPQPFHGFFFGETNFQISIKEFVQFFSQYPLENAYETFLRISPKMIEASLNNANSLADIYSILAELSFKVGSSRTFEYQKKVFEFRMRHLLENVYQNSPATKTSDYRAVYFCYSPTCNKCRFLQGKVVSVDEVTANPIIPFEDCIDGLCSAQIRLHYIRHVDGWLDSIRLNLPQKES